MANRADELKLVSALSENWPVLTFASLAIALAFNVGYFSKIVGNDPFIISVEDLAKSLIYAVTFFVSVQYIFVLVGNYVNAQTFGYKILTIVVAASGTVLPYAFKLVGAWKTDDWSLLQESAWSLALRFVVFILVMLFVFGKDSFFQRANMSDAIFGALMAIVLSYVYGVNVYYSDMKSIRSVSVQMKDNLPVTKSYISERSEFFLFYDFPTCQFELVKKDAVSTIAFSTADKSTGVKDALKACFGSGMQ